MRYKQNKKSNNTTAKIKNIREISRPEEEKNVENMIFHKDVISTC